MGNGMLTSGFKSHRLRAKVRSSTMSDLTQAREHCGFKSQEEALCEGVDLDWQKGGRKQS